jgi:hypothetical protein
MVKFTVTKNNGRDIWLETRVAVDAPYAMDREYEAKRQVCEALSAAATTFPPEWSRHLCDWCRFERWGSDGYFVVRMPAAMGQYVLALQEQETLQEAAS